MEEKKLESFHGVMNPSVGLENSQLTSKEEPVFADIMEDFSNAVVTPSETVILSKEDKDHSQSLDLVEDPVLEVAGGHAPEVPVLEVPDIDTTEVKEEKSIELESTVDKQDQSQKKEERKIMKDNWTFILILFAIVGAFVLLLPILVRLLGY